MSKDMQLARRIRGERIYPTSADTKTAFLQQVQTDKAISQITTL